MEAPLGASALMHSSTLVIAGLVLIFKLNVILELSEYGQVLMYTMGVLTALYGSFFATLKYELKEIMACSTISNMGYMFLLCSIFQYDDMLMLIVVHAYIKIFLFLMVGMVMLNCSGCQDLRYFGVLFSYSSQILIFFMIGGFCLAGLPYLSGYYYKLAALKAAHDSTVVFEAGSYAIVLSFFFTLKYVFRTLYLVFSTSKNGHIHIYKIKVNSVYYILILMILYFSIHYNASFWINLNFNDLITLFYNCTAKIQVSRVYKLFELSYELSFI
jgi:NADH:ubiquinone oxidoreductase subunit 5 (subunit L)/multisubunit Na+/H+ antiporter MnhA subunit